MKTLTDQLSQYAAYHRDPRNIRTHFVGIPMIVFSVIVLLNGIWGPLAWIGVVVTAAYYLRLDLRFGLTMLVLLGLGLSASQSLVGHWLASGIGLFVVGWVFQFIGHYYEGRKPAFVDDIMGLAIGPLFVVAEAGFLLGLRKEVEAEIVARTGPVRLNPHAQQTAA